MIDYQAEVQEALEDEMPDSDKIEKLVDFGLTLDVDLPEVPKLKQVRRQDIILLLFPWESCSTSILNTF